MLFIFMLYTYWGIFILIVLCWSLFRAFIFHCMAISIYLHTTSQLFCLIRKLRAAQESLDDYIGWKITMADRNKAQDVICIEK